MHERDAAAPFSFNFIVFLFLWAIIVAFRGTLNSDTQGMGMTALSLLHVIFFLGTEMKLWLALQWMNKLETWMPNREANEAPISRSNPAANVPQFDLESNPIHHFLGLV